MSKPALLYSDADGGFGSWRNVMISIFTGQLVEPHLAAIQKNHDDLLNRFPEGYLAVVILEPTARTLNASLRQPVVDLMTRMNKSNLAGCYVFNGGGVLMTSIRTVVSAMILASRPARPNKACGELTEAAEWLAKQNADSTLTRETYTGPEVLDAMRELQRRQAERLARSVVA